MQEDSDNKATSLDQKLQAGCIVFSLFDVDNIEYLEEVSETPTNMCQQDIDVMNIQGWHPKSYIMHYFPIIPTCARPFLTSKDESLDDDLTC